MQTRAWMWPLSLSLLSGCSFPLFDCENELQSEVLSTDGRWKLVAFSRGCGATTSDTAAHISLVGRDAGLPSEPGNLAVLEPARGRPARIALGWRATGEAEVKHAPDVEWFKQEASVQSVRVVYVSTP